MKVCYFGTYRESYTRNVIMIEALRRADVEVVECHQILWQGIEDRVSAASGGWAKPQFILRLVRAYWLLLKEYRKVQDYDVMVVGYPGQLDVLLARVLTWLRKKPLVLDILMSLYLIAQDRGLVEQHPFTGNLLHILERFVYRLPDLLIQDTLDYQNWLVNEFHLHDKRFRLLPLGADDRIFHPLEQPSNNEDTFRVLYYGTYIPNHGVPYIMEAAKIMGDVHDIIFTLIGEGPDKEFAQSFAQQHQMHNVEFISWLPKSELIAYIDRSDICLGSFGTTYQSLLTIHNKIYECMAMHKPVVTGDSSAIRGAFHHLDDIYLVERSNGAAIAKAIQHLYQDDRLRKLIASNGYASFMDEYRLVTKGKRLKSYLKELLQ